MGKLNELKAFLPVLRHCLFISMFFLITTTTVPARQILYVKGGGLGLCLIE